MKRNRAPSAQTLLVIQALAAAPASWRYGYDIGSELDLRSGSLYPILVRLADDGLLEAKWEASSGSRPPRHLYRLSAAGLQRVAALATAAAPRRTATHGPLLGGVR